MLGFLKFFLMDWVPFNRLYCLQCRTPCSETLVRFIPVYRNVVYLHSVIMHEWYRCMRVTL